MGLTVTFIHQTQIVEMKTSECMYKTMQISKVAYGLTVQESYIKHHDVSLIK